MAIGGLCHAVATLQRGKGGETGSRPAFAGRPAAAGRTLTVLFAITFYNAERQGFEPWEPVKVQHLSRMLLSATQASLRDQQLTFDS